MMNYHPSPTIMCFSFGKRWCTNYPWSVVDQRGSTWRLWLWLLWRLSSHRLFRQGTCYILCDDFHRRRSRDQDISLKRMAAFWLSAVWLNKLSVELRDDQWLSNWCGSLERFGGCGWYLSAFFDFPTAISRQSSWEGAGTDGHYWHSKWRCFVANWPRSDVILPFSSVLFVHEHTGSNWLVKVIKCVSKHFIVFGCFFW